MILADMAKDGSVAWISRLLPPCQNKPHAVINTHAFENCLWKTTKKKSHNGSPAFCDVLVDLDVLIGPPWYEDL